MKKVLAGLGLAVFAFSVALPAGAASINGVMDESTARINMTSRFNALVRVNQNANITNTATSVSTSGGNVIRSGDDQENVRLTTGNADAATLVTNSANHSEVSSDVESSSSTTTITNVDDESTATVTTTDTVNHDVAAAQGVTVDNDVASVGDTGSNRIVSTDDQEGVTAVTGTATSATAIENAFNTSHIVKNRIMRSMSR